MKYSACLLLILISMAGMSQERNWSVNGYVKDLLMYYHPKTIPDGMEQEGVITNIIHNRLNFKWYADSKLTVAVEMRNRLMFGNIIREFPEYRSIVDVDKGYFDLSWISANATNWFLHSMIDRAYLDYNSGNLQIRLGRQRINWGLNLVWNPNDVFNSFSYFDFDYEERPGTDAVKIQYYTGVTSSAELVIKLGKNKQQRALAGMYRFAKWDYDFQIISGFVGDDYIIGGGWTGNVIGGGFRGEITHFMPESNVKNPVQATVASISGDYTFKNSLYVHFGTLFNSHGTTGNAGGMNLLFNPEVSAKQLTSAKYALFAQSSYPVTPLFNLNISGILNPSDKSYYIGPTINYSLSNTVELMLTGQLFFGKEGSEFGDIGELAFGRLRWSF